MACNNIILHEEKGVNSKLTICHRCGKDIGVALLGKNEYVGHCAHCDSCTIGVGKRGGKCGNCGKYLDEERRLIDDYEKIPCGLCDKCEAEQKENYENIKKLIDAGGIYFKCLECGRKGAMAKSDATEAVRSNALEAGVIKNYDDEFGIEFDKCEQHGGAQ